MKKKKTCDHKRKACNSCNQCPLCEKPPECQSHSHKPQTITYNKSTDKKQSLEYNKVQTVLHIESSPDKTHALSSNTKRGSKRKAEEKLQATSYKHANFGEDTAFNTPSTYEHFKLEFECFYKPYGAKSSRNKRRIKAQLKDIMCDWNEKVMKAVCKTDDEIVLAKQALSELYKNYSYINNEAEEKLRNGALQLYKHGSRNSQLVIAALFSSVYGRNEFNNILEEHNDPAMRAIGRTKWSNTIRCYSELINGRNLKPERYTCRKYPRKLTTALDFIMNNSQILPGQLRSITGFNYIFKDFPVYERGSTNYEDFFNSYSKLYERKERVGLKIFTALCKILQRPVKQKTCLSSYYIEYCSLNKVLCEIFDTLEGFQDLKSEWDEVFSFAKYTFSEHLMLDDQEYHSCQFGLTVEKTCILDYHQKKKESTCIQCHKCFTYFSRLKVFHAHIYFSALWIID
jgi:hypothetical protein